MLDWQSSFDPYSRYWFAKHFFSFYKHKNYSYALIFILKKKSSFIKKENDISVNPIINLIFSKKNTQTVVGKTFKNFFSVNLKNSIFHKNKFFISNEKNLYNLNFNHKLKIFKINTKNLHMNLLTNKFLDSIIYKNNNLWNLFDINFLRKEKIYTKLKYSRVPQYDIVSGGVAALFAGFLGFLICEKFGFELLDSGDFYILFMYIVFLSFFCKLILNLFTLKNNNWSVISPRWLILFYKNLILLLISKFFRIFKK